MKYYKYIFFSIILCCFQLSYLYGQSLQELERLQKEYKEVLERQSLQKPKDVVDAEKVAKSLNVKAEFMVADARFLPFKKE